MDIVREGLHGGVSVRGFLAKCFPQDVIQVAGKARIQPARRCNLSTAGDRIKTAFPLTGRMACEDFIQDRAEGIYVGAGRLNRSGELFGTGVAWSKQPLDGLSRVASLIQQLGDTEIEKLRLSRRIHQYVGRFQVAMNDQVLMRVDNSIANALEQRELVT